MPNLKEWFVGQYRSVYGSVFLRTGYGFLNCESGEVINTFEVKK